MKKITLLILALASIGLAQARFGHGGSSLDLDTLLQIIADSTDWTAGSTVNAIMPKGGKSLEADSVKAGSLEVTGNARFNGNVTMVTTAGEQVRLGPGSDAAPELSSAGDTNTGIRFPGSDVITWIINGAESMRLAASGNLTLGSTGGWNRLGVVSATSGKGTGIGITSAQWNKNRTTLAQASDSSSIAHYIDSAGGPRFSMKAVDGDTLGMWLDGTYVRAKTSATQFQFDAKSNTEFAVNGTTHFIISDKIYPNADDAKSLGYMESYGNRRFQYGYFSDKVYVGGKGQGAQIVLSMNDDRADVADSAVTHTIYGGKPVAYGYEGNGSAAFGFANTNNQSTDICQSDTLFTITAAATNTIANLIPAGSMVVGVTTRVTTAITGDAGFTGFSVGDGTDADRWGANLTPTLGEQSDLTDCTITSVPLYNAATSIVLTQVGGSTFVAGGVVRITVHYIRLTAPTG